MSKITLHDKQILIVDDHRPFLLMLRSTLSNLGASSITILETPTEALEACGRQRFDIVICDVNLGNEQPNALQLLEQLRSSMLLAPEAIFVMTSGNIDRPMVLGKVEFQPDDFLIKPFSQAQLKHRLDKAWSKRRELAPVFSKIAVGDIRGAIDFCRNAITTGSRYRQYCSLVMTELLWRQEDFKTALNILDPLVKDKQLPWAVMAMAKTHMYMRQFQQAVKLAKSIVDNRVLAADSHEILAQCYLRTEKLEEACEEIKQAIDIAPESLERQYLGCEIAQAAGDYEFAKQCCLAILEQSRHSVHKNISHLCNYIRSIIELAEHAETVQQSNKYHQDAIVELQRHKHSELVKNSPQPFDIDAFEQIVTAQISVIQGKLAKARRALCESQQQIEEQYDEYPLTMAPDTIKVMFDLGEFEQASSLLEKVRANPQQPDPNTQRLLDRTLSKAKNTSGDYNQHRQHALECYNQGQFRAAYDSFKKATAMAPMNTGLTLNLIQVIGKLLELNTPDAAELKNEVRQLLHSLEGLHLPATQRNKYRKLEQELRTFLSK